MQSTLDTLENTDALICIFQTKSINWIGATGYLLFSVFSFDFAI